MLEVVKKQRSRETKGESTISLDFSRKLEGNETM